MKLVLIYSLLLLNHYCNDYYILLSIDGYKCPSNMFFNNDLVFDLSIYLIKAYLISQITCSEYEFHNVFY